MVRNVFLAILLQICLVSFFVKCHNSTEPLPTRGSIQGTVKSILMNNSSINHSAYLFSGDSLLTKTDDDGKYSISSIDEGTYLLTCSSLNYSDTTQQIKVIGGKTASCDFYLTPDSTTGKVSGEFQDIILYNDCVKKNPLLLDWDAKQIFEGVTGATVQSQTLQYHVPDRKVYLTDSLLAISDDFGQYWFEIQCGTYCLTGSCEGYENATQVIKILPDTRTYVNFFLYREETESIVSQ